MMKCIGSCMAFLILSGMFAQERASWMPEEASGGRESEGGERILLPVTRTALPKKTADITKFTRTYTLELKKFNISKDGSHPEATSCGINEALQYAKQKGFNRIIFPKGTYLVPENKPIVIDLKNTVIDFNGSTLTIVPNGQMNYSIVQVVQGAEHLRLTNGIIRGDRHKHDYKTQKGTHEGGTGLSLVSGRELEIDHMTFLDCTGDGVGVSSMGTRTRSELLARIFMRIYPKKHLESGGFNDRGEKIPSEEKTRTSAPIDMTKFEEEFEIGYLGGYQGFPFVLGRVFQVLFYDKDGKFLEKRKCLQYRKIRRPANALFMNLEFNQPEISDQPFHSGAAANSWVLSINNFLPPVDVHFHHNRMSGNRRLGLALCGGQRWIIEHNEFSGNGGTAPAYGVDLEDGWELVYDIVFRDNVFRGNAGGSLVVCAGSELLFERNLFESTPKHVNRIVFYGRAYRYFFLNNIVRGGTVSFGSRTGIATIAGNTYENCSLFRITYDNKGVADGLYRKNKTDIVKTPPLVLKNEKLVNVKKLGGTYISFENSLIDHVQAEAAKDTKLISFTNCTILDSTLRFLSDRNGITVRFGKNKGAFQIQEQPAR